MTKVIKTWRNSKIGKLEELMPNNSIVDDDLSTFKPSVIKTDSQVAPSEHPRLMPWDIKAVR